MTKSASAFSAVAFAAAFGLASCSVREEAPAPAPVAPPAEVVDHPRPPPPTALRAPPPKVSCVPRAFPKAPRYPDTDQALRAAGGAADRYQLLAAGRLARAKRLAELERIVDNCR